jgi:hypothetical protein
LKAEKFNELYGYDADKSASWIVEYRKRLPPGVLAETPGNILVLVEEGSGAVRQVFRETI